MRVLLAIGLALVAASCALAWLLPGRHARSTGAENAPRRGSERVEPADLVAASAPEVAREVAHGVTSDDTEPESAVTSAEPALRELDDDVARVRSVTMRLLGPDGAALDRRACVARYEIGAARMRTNTTSDADGGFGFALASQRSDGVRPPRRFEVRAGDSLGARVAVPPDLEPKDGVLDLGDVVLFPLPVLVRGVVRDSDGLPLGGATVTADLFTPSEDSASAPRDDSSAMSRTADDGAFRFAGWTDGDTHVHLAVSHRASPAGASLDVPIGSAGVDLVLRGGGSIAGSVLLDEGVPTNSVLFGARRESDGRTARGGTRAADDGRVVLVNLAPGVYTVTAHAAGGGRVLAEVPGVEVRVGERARPTGLDPLDLRGRFLRHVITVVDGEGQPIEAAVFHRASREKAGEETAEWVRAKHAPDAPALAFTASEAIDVVAAAQDRAWAERTRVGGAITLRCGATYPVRLRLQTPLDEAHRARLTAVLRPAHADGRVEMHSRSATFDADGTCTLQARGLGEHVVDLRVGGIADVRLPVGEDGRHRVHVTDSRVPAELAIEVSAEQMDEEWKSIEGLIDAW